MNGSFTKAEMLQILHDHITAVVTRYKGRIQTWDVVNEAIDDGKWRDTFWYARIGPEYVDSAFVWAHRADPQAKLFYNDYGIEIVGPKTDTVAALLERLQQRGIPVDGVGLQCHFNMEYAPPSEELLASISFFAARALDIRISEFDVWMRDTDATTPEARAKQAAIYGAMLRACLAIQRCRAFVSWGFTDRYSWVPEVFPDLGSALPFDANYRPKPALEAMLESLSGR